MEKMKSIALVGIGGYGSMYCSAFDDPRFAEYKLAAIVDPHLASSPTANALKKKGAFVSRSIDEIPADIQVDLAIISSPMQFHARQSVQWMGRGANVLCEKPLCATVEQAMDMAAGRDVSGKHVAIGYQWSYSQAIHRLKADIKSGLLGAPKQFRTIVLWPRNAAYFRRNSWAGARFDSQGLEVFDSPLNNACAHYLHNMLYVLGDQPHTSAIPREVMAELYRAHPIDNYDTAVVRCTTSTGVELVYVTTHTGEVPVGPEFVYEFEHATVRFKHGDRATIVAEFADGHVVDYGSPEETHYNKLLMTIAAIHAGQPPLCGIEAAAAHTQVMSAAQNTHCGIVTFPPDAITRVGAADRCHVIVEGVHDGLQECYERGCLPSELGMPWAQQSKAIPVTPLRHPSPKSVSVKVVTTTKTKAALVT